MPSFAGKVITQQPVGATGRYAYVHVAMEKENQFEMVLDCPGSVYYVKNTNVKRFGERGGTKIYSSFLLGD